MNIKLKKVKLHNFLSFKDAELNLDTPGYILVKGINNNPTDNAYSNGSGKSAILESISWALTGETIRGSKDVLRMNIEDKDKLCYVSLYFMIDDNTYEIYRQLNPSKLKLIVNNEDISGKGVRDTEKILKEYLPDLNTSLIGSVIILGQGLPQRFTNNTPSGRKDVLEKLSKSDFMIQDLKTRINNRKKELDEKIRENEDNLLKSKTQKSMYCDDLIILKERYANLPDINELTYEFNEVVKDKEEIEDRLKDISEKIDWEKNNQINNLKEKNNIMKEFSDKISELSKPFDLQLSDLNSSKIDIETKIKYLKLEINKLKSIKDVCPTCGQKLPVIERPSTEEQENILSQKEQELKKIKDLMMKKSEEKTAALVNLNSDKNSALLKNEDEYNSISISLNNLNNYYKDFNKQLTEKNSIEIKLDNEIKNFEKSKKELENRIDNTNQSIKALESKLLYINNNIKELHLHHDIIQKMNTVITRDFRGYLLTFIIDFIDRKAKEYSQEVFETDKIDFCLDGNNISISYDGKDYANLSGGEKQKVDLIVQFSIRDMLRKYLNFSSNIIAVDELFDNLDSIGCEKVLNLLSNKLSDVDSIYIITHHSSIPIPFDKIITVTKGVDGVSRLDVV